MKTTCYFEEQVLRKRPYLRCERIDTTLAALVVRSQQEDGQIRFWGRVE